MPPAAVSSNGAKTLIFHNSFNIQGGTGGNGSVDMRRTVQILADQLEGEMNRRMARSN